MTLNGKGGCFILAIVIEYARFSETKDDFYMFESKKKLLRHVHEMSFFALAVLLRMFSLYLNLYVTLSSGISLLT